MKTIKVRANGGFVETLVDDADFEIFSLHAWRLFGAGYVGRKVYTHCKDGKSFYRADYMHRLVLSAPPDVQVDHINRNKLDNRRSNLRTCTASENGCNKPPQATKNGLATASRFKGVRRAAPATRMKSKPWVAEIRTSGRRKNLGYFATEEEAAAAYDAAAIERQGEFAYLNFAP